jgi:hypothetical protein
MNAPRRTLNAPWQVVIIVIVTLVNDFAFAFGKGWQGWHFDILHFLVAVHILDGLPSRVRICPWCRWGNGNQRVASGAFLEGWRMPKQTNLILSTQKAD